MSNQVIETLDYLCEKFRVSIDWTAENMVPYVEELVDKIITYNIIICSTFTVVGLILIIGAIIGIRYLIKYYSKCKNDGKDNMFWEEILCCVDPTILGIVSIIAVITGATVGAIMFFGNMDYLLKWIFVPEIPLVELFMTFT